MKTLLYFIGLIVALVVVWYGGYALAVSVLFPKSQELDTYPVISCTVEVFGAKNTIERYDCVKVDSVIAFYTPKSKGIYYIRLTIHEPTPSSTENRKD